MEPSRSSAVAARLVTLLLVVAVAFGVFVVVRSVVGAIRGGQEVAVRQQIDVGAIGSLPANVVGPGTIDVTVRVKDARPKQVLYAMGRDLVPGALVIGILWLLRGIMGSVRLGDPFTRANVRRLRLIGFALLIGSPIVELVRSAFEQALSSTVDGSGSGLSITLPGSGVIAGLGVLVLAQVFDHGVRLHEDVEATI